MFLDKAYPIQTLFFRVSAQFKLAWKICEYLEKAAIVLTWSAQLLRLELRKPLVEILRDSAEVYPFLIAFMHEISCC